MSTPGRSALRQPAHVFRETPDVERRVLHVVADVVGPRLSVFHPLLEAAFCSFMRARVVDRLTVLEQLDRLVDSLWRRRLRGRAGDDEE